MLAEKLAGSGVADKLYVDDVFSSFVYQGNGSTQTINNGIDLAGKGGLVWIKNRDRSAEHYLFDTERGVQRYFALPSTQPSQFDNSYSSSLTSFNSSGFSVQSFNTSIDAACNRNGERFASWTFRKAPKFFDVVTYTGTDSGSRVLSHNLGVIPGMVIIKSTSLSDNWYVYHGALTVNNGLLLNTTDPMNVGPISSVTDKTITLKNIVNGYSAYVAYLFAHDTSTDGIIQCGSFTTDGSGNATVNLGWEPQYLMVKRSNAAGGWFTFDTFRGWSRTMSNFLNANTSGAESVYANTDTYPTATGFVTGGNITNASSTFVYLAIRRPNKPPTTGTKVYNAIARTGTGAAATVTGMGFAPDLALYQSRAGYLSNGASWMDRLRGNARQLYSYNTNAEGTDTNQVSGFDAMDGVRIDVANAINASAQTYINHFFRRAPGFFDVVCYTGTGVNRTVPHSLGVAPELMIVKNRSSPYGWPCYHSALGPTQQILLNGGLTPQAVNVAWSDTSPTPSVFTLGSSNLTNEVSANHVAYLFATLPGVSKVGSYTGNGTSQTIDCGFTTGARFILIKRTDSTGDWYVWDTARGIVSANDPHLSLNTTAAEVTTDDSVDPDNSGFIVNQVAATNINVTGASYIFLAIA